MAPVLLVQCFILPLCLVETFAPLLCYILLFSVANIFDLIRILSHKLLAEQCLDSNISPGNTTTAACQFGGQFLLGSVSGRLT